MEDRIYIGTHNSMTYLRPAKWWARRFNIFARCQCEDITEQYKAGMRCFDIRIYWDWRQNNWCFAHGLVRYHFNDERDRRPLEYVLDTLRKLHEKQDGKIFIRLILEKTKDIIIETRKFDEYCGEIENKYKEFTFLGGFRKKDWERVHIFPAEDETPIHQFVGSMMEDARFYEKIMPITYAERMNSKNLIRVGNGVNIFDFIKNR